MGRRVGQGVVGLAAALALLAGPALPGAGSPPRQEATDVPVGAWQRGGDWVVGEVDGRDVVLFSADLDAAATVELRTRRAGAWTAWTPMARAGDHGPDPHASSEATAHVADPVWVAHAEQVQVRVPAGAPQPSALPAVVSDGGDGLGWTPPTGTEPGAASALSVWPAMVPRSSWDPGGDCQPKALPDYAPSVERAYVHHTAMYPDYLPDEVDDLVRAMCVFHVERRGFDDLGYNFLVDRYGRIYQGRAGGILRPVVGAHASGFNRGSVGIALIGDFDDQGVPPVALASLDRLLTWLFEWHGIDPYAVTPHVSTGGATTPHAAGTVVMLPTIVGHRQTATNTACPGDRLFEHVNGADPAIHRIAAGLRDRGIEVGDAVHPPVEPTVLATDPSPVVAEAPTPQVEQLMERVVAAVWTLATRRLDERLLPVQRP